MTLIFNNIYIYIFIALYIIHFILKKILNNDVKSLQRSSIPDKDFIFYLHNNIKDYNIIFSFFMLFIYILVALIPFLILRINRLGLTYNITEGTFTNILFFVPLISVILSIIYFFKIVNFIIYPYIIKLHFYCYYKSPKYLAVISSSFLREDLLYDYCTNIFSFFYKITQPKKDFIAIYKRFRALFPQDSIEEKNHIQKYLFYLHLRYFVNRFYIVKLCCYTLCEVFHSLIFHISRFSYYLPYSVVIIFFIYDLTEGVLYYIFYALLYFFITNIIKKIRRFYKDKDPVFDDILATYFYKNEDLYQEFKTLVENEDSIGIDYFKLFNKSREISRILTEKENIINYINVDYKVYYVIDPIRASNEKIIMGIYKRIHLLLLLAIFNTYIIYYNKYTLIYEGFEINLSIITVFMLSILYIIHRFIAKETPEQWVENRKMKLYFSISIISYIIIILYLFLKNKLDHNMIDVIINIKDILKIRENFTLTEKYKYISTYIELLKTNESYDAKILDKILLEYKEKPQEIIHMTLEKLKISIHEIYQEIKLQGELNETKKSTILQKILKILHIKK